LSCNGIVKKQSFKSIIIITNPAGIMAVEGRPGYKAPTVCMALLMAQRSYVNLYFPLASFCITKIGLFHVLLEGFSCPAFICCYAKIWACCNFCPEGGHWSTHIGSLISHFSGTAVGWDFISMAPRW
jgi:hypothetical protein